MSYHSALETSAFRATFALALDCKQFVSIALLILLVLIRVTLLFQRFGFRDVRAHLKHIHCVDVMAMSVCAQQRSRDRIRTQRKVLHQVTSSEKQRRHKIKGPREKVATQCRKEDRLTEHLKNLRSDRKRTACTEGTEPTLPMSAHTC